MRSDPRVPGAAISTSDARSFCLRSGDQRNRAAFTVTNDTDVPLVDVLPFAKPLRDGEDVIGEILDRCPLVTPATLADAALVVADHQVAALRERAGELGEDRDPEDILLAIHAARSRHENDGGMPEPSCRLCRQRHCSGEVEAKRRNDHVSVGRVAGGLLTNGD